jgi:hypothetical protein
MEAICSSETSTDIQRTTWRYIPEDGTLQNQTTVPKKKNCRTGQVESEARAVAVMFMELLGAPGFITG